MFVWSAPFRNDSKNLDNDTTMWQIKEIGADLSIFNLRCKNPPNKPLPRNLY